MIQPMFRDLARPLIVVFLFAATACNETRSRADDLPLPKLELRTTPDGRRYGLWGPPPSEPCPVLFIFAGPIEDSLTKTSYCEAGQRLQAERYLCVSLDLPCHGADGRSDESHDLSGWRQRVEKGEDLTGDFARRAGAVLDELVRQGWCDPARVAACGTSRGGFMAMHFAAADRRVGAVAAFAPVTELLALREFDGIADPKLAERFSLSERARELAERPVWITIGNQDERVGSQRAVRLADKVRQAAAAQQLPERCSLEVLPSAGHQTPAGAHERAAKWLRLALPSSSK